MKRTVATRLSCCTLVTLMIMMIRSVRAWTLPHRRSSLHTCLESSSLRTITSTTAQDCAVLWDEELPVGARCVGLQLLDAKNGDWLPKQLHPLEIEYGLQLPSTKTKQSFWLGRLALRQVIDTTEPILKDSYGRPRLPDGYVASISHKAHVGVALVQPHASGSLGVDLEYSQPQGNRNVARKVLTNREQQTLGQIPTVTPEEEVLLRFSMKESLYKAMHPYLCHYVGFQQVEIQPTPEGGGNVQLLFPNATLLSDVTIYWQRLGPYFLSSCRVHAVRESTTTTKG